MVGGWVKFWRLRWWDCGIRPWNRGLQRVYEYCSWREHWAAGNAQVAQMYTTRPHLPSVEIAALSFGEAREELHDVSYVFWFVT